MYILKCKDRIWKKKNQSNKLRQTLNIEIAEVIKITQKAGEEILQIYNSENFNVEIKADNSPLTRADKASHQIIEEGLKKIYP